MTIMFPISSPFQIFEMDLFTPVKDQNDYGARSKKNVSMMYYLLLDLFLMDGGTYNIVFGAPLNDSHLWCFLISLPFSSLQLKTGKLGPNSYVPAGLTAAQYQKIRDAEDKKKASNYEKNVKKAGKFLDYTEFYTKRGTDVSQDWIKSPGRGHTFAKTKYSSDTAKDGKNYDGGNK